MSLGVSIEREQNAVSKNFCGNYPHFGASHQSTNSILDPVGFVDHEESSLHTLPGEASQYFTRQHSSSLIKAKTSQSRTPNKYASDYVTWYSDDNIAVNQTGYETQGFTEYGNMMPPYYASERKYIELWVQCPRQPGIDSCEHSSQPICYTECYEPATNSRESLDWENNKWVYEDGSSRNANTQVCCLGSSENHEEQQYGEFHIDCELSNSKPCDSLSFNAADIQNLTEESLYRVTADTEYEEVEARMLNSEFNGRVEHGEITEHVTKSVSFSSESIKIEVLNRESSLDFSQNSVPLVTEKIHRVKSQRRSRHRRKSKVPIDGGSVLNPNGSSSTVAKNTKHEVSLIPYEPPLRDCDRFERYLNRELIKYGSYDKYVRAEPPMIGDAMFSKKLAFKCQNSKSPVKSNSHQNKSGRHQIRQQKSIPTSSERRAKATADDKPSITSSAKTLKATNKIDTLCKAVTKYIPEMCKEQKLIAGQLILTVLGDGVKNLLSKSTVLVTKESHITQCSTSLNLKSKYQTTQCPETRPSANPCNTAYEDGDITWSGAKSKRTRRRPRWKKKKIGLDQQLQKVPTVNIESITGCNE